MLTCHDAFDKADFVCMQAMARAGAMAEPIRRLAPPLSEEDVTLLLPPLPPSLGTAT